LHGHPEELALLAVLIDRRHLRCHSRDLLLERDAVLLRFEHLGVRVVDADHLERHVAAGFGIEGEVDVADRSAAEEVAELEAVHLLLGEHHGWPRRRCGAGCGAAGGRGGAGVRTASAREAPPKEFQARISSARSAVASSTPPPPLPSKRLSISSGRAPSRTSTPGRAGKPGGRPLRAIRLPSRRAAAVPSTSTPPPGLSWR